MKNAKIKFIRMYKMHRENWYEVVYNSGRCCTYIGERDLPKTASEFVATACKRTEYYDKIFNRNEMIYEA